MVKQKKLRWGILGAARINQQLMPAIVAAENSELVAMSSRRPDAAAETLAKYAPDQQNVKIFDDPSSLLEDPDVQAVYIPLSNHEHAEWTLRAIKQGKHVLCEKPLALKRADIEAIEAAAYEEHVAVMEGFMYRFHPQHAKLMNIINNGRIGEVRMVKSSFAFMLQPAREYRIADPVEKGGGAMWDIGCYAIHAARFPFMKEAPLSVAAMAKFTKSGVDLGGCGSIDYGNGRYAQFEYSFEHARRAEYEVIGTKGGLKCHNVWAKPNEHPVISWWTEDGENGLETLTVANHFLLEIEHFSDCVLNNKSPALSIADSEINCQVIVAALQSNKDGRSIKLV